MAFETQQFFCRPTTARQNSTVPKVKQKWVTEDAKP